MQGNMLKLPLYHQGEMDKDNARKENYFKEKGSERKKIYFI